MSNQTLQPEQPRAHYEELARQAARVPKPIDVRGVIATVIADLRASGDTGMVENLLEADALLAEFIEAAREYREGTRCHVEKCIYCHDRSTRLDVALASIGGASNG